MKPAVEEELSTQDVARLEYISAEGLRYFKALQAAKKDGGDLADYLDPEGLEALHKLTAMTGGDLSSQFTMARTMPVIVETDERGMPRPSDIFSLFVRKRIVHMEGVVDDTMASIICATLRYLNSEASGSPEKEIKIYVNSPGGNILPGLAIYDTMREIGAPVTTIGRGMQASMGSALLIAGDTRKITRNSWVMLSQVPMAAGGQHSDIAIRETLVGKLHEQLKSIYVRHTGLTHEFWDLALERNTWLSAEQALKIGLVDAMIVTAPGKGADFEREATRKDFQEAREILVPDSAEKIVKMLNNVSANDAMAGAIRPELITALSQYPQFWTDAKKEQMAQQAKEEAEAAAKRAEAAEARRAEAQKKGQESSRGQGVNDNNRDSTQTLESDGRDDGPKAVTEIGKKSGGPKL